MTFRIESNSTGPGLARLIEKGDIEFASAGRRVKREENAGMYQLTGIAEFCHELEEKLPSSGLGLDDADRAGLAELWEAFSKRLQAMLGTDQPDGIVIEDTEYAQILTALTRGMPRRDILTMIIEIIDDGAGIAWGKVRERARELPHTTTTDLQAALFADGLSTRDDVSDTSGRGVGMAPRPWPAGVSVVASA